MQISKLDSLVKTLNDLFSLTSLHVINFDFHNIIENEELQEILPIKIIATIDDSLFVHDGQRIIAHLSKSRMIDRLLRNLIEYYNFMYENK